MATLTVKLFKGLIVIKGSIAAAVTGRGMIMADDKMGAPEIFTNDHVKNRFPGPCHPHGNRLKVKHVRVRWVMGRHFLVTAHAGEMVKIAGLGETGNGEQ